MITLVTGTPRSGKTLWCIEQLHQYILAPELRPIFSDIKGFSSNVVQPSPDDWRTVPDNSVIFYDECQFRKEFSSRFKGDCDMILDLTTHGHRGIDIYFITQGTRYMNSDIFPLVGQHVHVHNSFNSNSASKLYKFRTVQTNLSKSNLRDSEDTLTWRYPKHLFDTYKSASVHNKKRAFPKKLVTIIVSLIMLVLMAIFYFYQLFSDKNNFTHPSDDKHKQAVTSPAQQQKQQPQQNDQAFTVKPTTQPQVQDETRRIAMVSMTETTCRAYAGNGDFLPIDTELCMLYGKNPQLLKAAPQEVRDRALQSYNYSSQSANTVSITTKPII